MTLLVFAFGGVLILALVSAVSVEKLPEAICLTPFNAVAAAVNAAAAWAVIGPGHCIKRQLLMSALTAVICVALVVGILLACGGITPDAVQISTSSSVYLCVFYVAAQLPFWGAKYSCGLQLSNASHGIETSTILRFRLVDAFVLVFVVALLLMTLQWTALVIGHQSKLRTVATIASLHVVCVLFIAPLGLRIAFLKSALAAIVTFCAVLVAAWIFGMFALAIERAVFDGVLTCRGGALPTACQSLTLLSVMWCVFRIIRANGGNLEFVPKNNVSTAEGGGE